MADTLLEQTRALHEDMERLERVIVKDLKRDMKGHLDKLQQSHRVKRRLDAIQNAARKLVKIYEDEDGARKEDIAALANKDNPFAAFYDRLKEIKDYHTRFSTAEITEAESDEHLLKEEPAVSFTGEEGLGRYLDLHTSYSAFVNSKFGSKLEYYEYVTGLATHLAGVSRPAKATAAYRQYVQGLLEYLISFYQRAQPLAHLTRQLDKVTAATQEAFDVGTLPGWEDQGLGKGGADAGDGPAALPAPTLDLNTFSSAEQLETVGPERLRDALAAMGLKSGGTPKERAARLWLAHTTPLHLLDKKHFAKGAALPAPAAGQAATPVTSEQLTEAVAAKQKAAAREVAVLEAQVAKLCELLANVISDTKGRVEKRQAQTYEEMMAEQAEAEAEAAAAAAGEGGGEGSEGEDEYIYNPLRLPLGWDGKPIPYWLYKLHGLNQEFKCEICGNTSYWGRRAFERHFKEWRHQNGMRALGIPNTKAFFEITRIEDAEALWADIQSKQKAGFKAEVEEEFEDSAGNVYNRRTYMDLKKQGLI